MLKLFKTTALVVVGVAVVFTAFTGAAAFATFTLGWSAAWSLNLGALAAFLVGNGYATACEEMR